MVKKWTEEEDNIIREFYPSEGYKIIKYFPNRTEGALRHHAIMLGVRRNPNYKFENKNSWTDKEDKILIDIYASHNYEIKESDLYDCLPNRKNSAIISRAHKLGIKMQHKLNEWTEGEDEIIKSKYPSEGSKIHRYLPNRSLNAIFKRASLLGVGSDVKYVQSTHSNAWTEEEDEIIKSGYPNKGIGIRENLPNRTEIAIRARAYTLGVKRRQRRKINSWTKREDEILIKLYPFVGSNVRLKLPNRTRASISSRAMSLGIKYIPLSQRKTDDINES